jgi:hypothetical protein
MRNRAIAGLGLMAILATHWLSDSDPGAPVRVTAATPTPELIRALSRTEERGVVYADTVPPTREVATLLAGVAARDAEATLIVPGRIPTLSVTPPVAPVAGRRSALVVTLRAEPGSDVPVVVDGGSGSADTASVRIGPAGSATVAIAIEPTRAGPGAWTVYAGSAGGGAHVTARAWVKPASPVRVLVLTGPPGWESKYLIRALEAAGVRVSVHQALGRGQVVATPGVVMPETMDDLAAWDVVALVGPGAAVPAGALRRWIVERGGGLLMVGPVTSDGELTPWAPRSSAAPLPAPAIRWTGPAEIVPLPAAELFPRVGAVPTTGQPVAWGGETDSTVFATADWVGRGRVFATGIESWPWAMEAGLEEGHRQFWESVVEWLADGLTSDLALEGGVGPPGVVWTGRLAGTIPRSLDIRRPSGTGAMAATNPAVGTPDNRTEPLALYSWTGPSRSGRSRHVRFVPVATGGHTLGTGPGGPDLGVVIVDRADRGSWTEAALQVGRAGGVVRIATEASTSTTTAPLERPIVLRWLAFLVLGALVASAWAARRLAGLS